MLLEKRGKTMEKVKKNHVYPQPPAVYNYIIIKYNSIRIIIISGPPVISLISVKYFNLFIYSVG